jgi:hypothetical protein
MAPSRRVTLLSLALLFLPSPAGGAPPRHVDLNKDGKLVYHAEDRGNRILDFSHCGYRGGDSPIPAAHVRVVVRPTKGDNGPRIQAALDYVAKLKLDAKGLRGAVLLVSGRYEVAGQLRLHTSGVVLRGQGPGPKGTLLVASGTSRRTLIQVCGTADRKFAEAAYTVAEKYVPVGSRKLRLDKNGLKAGDRVVVEHPATKEWIAALGMDRFPTDRKGSWHDWRPGTLDVHFGRTVTAVDGETITLDAPLPLALDAKLSKCKVRPYSWPGRISNVGIEGLRLESAFDAKNRRDEDHAWGAVGIECAEDVWVRRVTMAHFAGSAVAVWETARHVSVEDCESSEPVSEVGGYRRHTFYTNGQMTLFRRCKAKNGRHDFAAGYLAAGPSAFVHCEAADAHRFSGPIESWACGVLYDNVTIDGGGLSLTNRETAGHGVGWSAANCVLWQCVAPTITCRMPPTAQNWAIGCWGQFVGNGHWQSMNQAVKPGSLYEAQLAERLGKKAAEISKSSPASTAPTHVKTIEELAPELLKARPRPTAKKPLAVKNGFLVAGGKLVTGSAIGTVWWRGHVLPSRAARMGPGVTRFVPGRVGPGFTDDLDQLTDAMLASHQALIHHHHGLWYDRRRDDHQMVRRADAEVWPPFYEMPWARSGKGKAWDGLSKYDLTKFNPWYFARLKELADHCDHKGLVLVQQMYFQHNVLEAGAHWADLPWRPANCLQDTGFPEPPPYVNKKRVFMAEAFYDVKHAERRKLHRAYIRHCLDVLGDNSNVVFQTGEEFTGPLSFMQFWLDTVAEWEKEKGRKVLVSLSCTKDVQDAILKDPVRGPRISVIDLKYWWYTANGGTFAPKGGNNLSPRQQLREWKGSKSRSDASISRMVREYRERYPDKAVLCSLVPANGWGVLAAGGSVPSLPPIRDAGLLAALPRMKPFAAKTLTAEQRALAEPGRHYFVHSLAGRTIRLPLPDATATYSARWIDLKTGQTREVGTIAGGRDVEWNPPGSRPAALWVSRKDAREATCFKPGLRARRLHCVDSINSH